jgi:hypothetical protein
MTRADVHFIMGLMAQRVPFRSLARHELTFAARLTRLRARGAAERAAYVSPVIAELQAAGATSLRAIAAGLNARGIPTARGSGSWSATQVLRTMARRETYRIPQSELGAK